MLGHQVNDLTSIVPSKRSWSYQLVCGHLSMWLIHESSIGELLSLMPNIALTKRVWTNFEILVTYRKLRTAPNITFGICQNSQNPSSTFCEDRTRTLPKQVRNSYVYWACRKTNLTGELLFL